MDESELKDVNMLKVLGISPPGRTLPLSIHRELLQDETQGDAHVFHDRTNK